MALFTDLHHVGLVISEHIRAEIGIDDVQPGPPRDAAASTDPGARVTFLYTTPQPGHRSDPLEPLPDGTRRPPPLSLSCFYLLTTSGADADDPIAAHNALGEIITLFHDGPELQLPLSDGSPVVFSDLGEGTLAVVQVPMSLDQVDKIWSSLDAELQPWALFEVAPVQLVSTVGDLGPAPLVRPGGIGLDIAVGRRPVVTRITPEAARSGGAVRIDVVADGEPDAVDVAGVHVEPGPRLTLAPDGTPLRLALTDGALASLPAGPHSLTVRAAGMVSRRATVWIAPAGAAIVDAPALSHDPGQDLVLTGVDLGGAQEAFLWPDAGMTAPSDVQTLAIADVQADSVTVTSGELGGLPPERGPWRLTLRVGDQVFTPYVVLELSA